MPVNLWTRFSYKCKKRYGCYPGHAVLAFVYAVLQDDIKLELSPTGKKYACVSQPKAVMDDDSWDSYRVRLLKEGKVLNTTTFLDSDFR